MINEILYLKPSIQGSILISLKINSTNFAIIFYPKQLKAEMGNGLLKSEDLHAFKSKNQRLDQNCHIKEKRNIPFIIQVIMHVLMNGLFVITAELP